MKWWQSCLVAGFILCLAFAGSMRAEQSPAERIAEIQAALREAKLEGWLFYDAEHAKESAHTFKQGSDLWRATAWEIHPVTRVEIVR